MTNIKIQGMNQVGGRIKVPGDKSISHRAAILSAISEGDTRVKGFLEGDDTIRTLNAFEECGVNWTRGEDYIAIEGRGRKGLKEPSIPIDLGNSGTGMRLLTGLFAGCNMFVVLTGDTSLRARPIDRVVNPLREMGAKIDGREGGGKAPVAIRGANLKGIEYEMPVASAQVKSALLLAGLWAEGETWVREPGPARNHTEIMLGGFGAEVLFRNGGWIGIRSGEGDKLKGGEITVPGDISGAAFFITAALVAPEGEITIEGVGTNPTRTGIIDIFREMGADIEITNERTSGGEPLGDITVRAKSLQGSEIKGETVIRAIDEFPVVAVAAAYAQGDTVISGASELRVKESDRIASMAAELAKMGVDIKEKPDGMTIHGGKPLEGAILDSHGDHRVAMALTVAALGARGESTVKNTECILTSFPSFENLLEEVISN